VKTSLAQIQSFVEAVHNQGALRVKATAGDLTVEVEFRDGHTAEEVAMLMKQAEVSAAMDKLTTIDPADAAEGAVAGLVYQSAG
jgi:hypothetical protein